MQVGDLVMYGGTGLAYICVELIGKVYCRLHGFPENQVFKIDECNLKVVSKCR
jgi:hypothetical protein